MKSEIADFTNTGGRAGGAITAALFLKEFTGDHPWVHIDIAGTAWAEEAKPYQPKGPTGVAERGTDVGALAEGFVSISPLQLDLTAYRALTDLNTWRWDGTDYEPDLLDNKLALFRGD